MRALEPSHQILPSRPSPGKIVEVRQRRYLVEEVSLPPSEEEATLVSLSCIDDDAQGEPLEVLWEHEIDARVVTAPWEGIGRQGFDPTPRFAAYLHTLRWSMVTATTPRLFQAPFRAGIEVMAYQLEPLRKALHLPRVNLFIADDVGLGKTIEAGLVLREMIMRQRVRRVIVAAPASVVLQWREELEQRFGLGFAVYDRDYVARCRRERGYSTNPWTTHTRFIISHALLRDEDYAAPLRGVLGDFEPGSLLILDEAHHVAPAQSSRYAIDSKLTRAVRDLAERFEHRLFLSATPHNGLSNSFSALLEILDPQRFVRGTEVDPKLRDEVMVRRLKSDLREVSGGFPERNVIAVRIEGLPPDAPELALAALLDEYWELREARLAKLPPKERAAQGLVLVNLQKRLFSSIEAFARTLKAHRRALDRAAREGEGAHDDHGARPAEQSLLLLAEAPGGGDDERADLPEDRVDAEEEQVMEDVTRAARALAPTSREIDLVRRMEALAEETRRLPDARVRHLIDWIRAEMCPDLPPIGEGASGRKAAWRDKRVIVFTEYADTKRYVEQQLRAAVASTERADDRIATFHGGMPTSSDPAEDAREQVKLAFTTHPSKHPLRILIATDAAREGVNLQYHCADLFHMDLPWNPARLEQRNGRIDRKKQPAPEVRCHYFVYEQRKADRVLEVLMERSRVIQKELGSMPPVLEERVTRSLAGGIGPSRREAILSALREDIASPKAAPEELEGARSRKGALEAQLEALRTLLDQSRRTLDLGEGQLQHVLSEALSMIKAPPLAPAAQPGTFTVPALDARLSLDPSWADTLDTLRAPRPRGTSVREWRAEAPILPVVFNEPEDSGEDTVHLHLEHRLVQRLLGRFLAQGFVHDDLTRACAGQTSDAVRRVVLLGRLSLYGERASRLHDEIVAVAARWTEPSARGDGLKPYADDGQEKSWDLLLDALAGERRAGVPAEVQTRLVEAMPRDVTELLPHLMKRCEAAEARARGKLAERGKREAAEMIAILNGQKTRIEREIERASAPQLSFDFTPEERYQLDDNMTYWRRRLLTIPGEMEREPARIERAYRVEANRIEPVGLVYLWPVSG